MLENIARPAIATARKVLVGLVCAAAVSVSPARAANPPFDAVAVIEGWLLPRYDALASTTDAQKSAWAGFCAKPEAAGVPALKEAYGKAADAWNAVEFVTFGPISQNLRPDRFSFFPDRRNGIARGMADMIGDTDAARLSPERFDQASAAIQGLPALERLLYDEGAAEALVAGPEAARRCAFGLAIATNLATIAHDVRAAWGDRSSGLLGGLAAGKGDPALFPDAAALPGMILTDLSGAFQRVTDTKILPVLGSGPSEAKPLAADNWRSGRSGRVAANMVKSADALLRAIATQMPSRPQWVVNKAATEADATADKLPADLGAAAQTASGAATLQAAIKTFKAAQLAVYRPMASYFGISLGFNALDGD
ncbi:imelysin family protein [Xanthobacter sp. V4C-4]|uniref:imelysin family protein n=1 Tax=Xanthobacter cornucopiae TaxID=3119924 RepID=UPI003727DFC6